MMAACRPDAAASVRPVPARSAPVVWTTSTRSGLKCTLSPRAGKVEVGALAEWIAQIDDNQGQPVYPARLALRGEMIALEHRLAVQPIVTAHLGEGRYLIEGVNLDKIGVWRMQLQMLTADGREHTCGFAVSIGTLQVERKL